MFLESLKKVWAIRPQFTHFSRKVGSANVFMLPKVSESLARRVEVLTLEPFSQAEIQGSAHNLVDALFGVARWTVRTVGTERADLVRRLCASGFPEVLDRADLQRRAAWFHAYLASLLQRDVRDYGGLQDLAQANGQNFVRGLVFYTGDQLLPFADKLWPLACSAWQPV